MIDNTILVSFVKTHFAGVGVIIFLLTLPFFPLKESFDINHICLIFIRPSNYVVCTCIYVAVLSAVSWCDHRTDVSATHRREVTLIPVQLSDLSGLPEHLKNEVTVTNTAAITEITLTRLSHSHGNTRLIHISYENTQLTYIITSARDCLFSACDPEVVRITLNVLLRMIFL